MCRTLAHDGGLKASPKIVGQLIKFRIAVDFDRLARGIADDVAVVTPGEMILKFRLGAIVQRAIKVIG
jgi:hypothetical protein